jgi:hypothetical protein
MLRVCAVIVLMAAVCLGLVDSGGAQDPPDPKKLNPYTGKESALAEGRPSIPLRMLGMPRGGWRWRDGTIAHQGPRPRLEVRQ